jgi:stage V sporulation protein R
MDDWQREVIEILRREAYYFAGQGLTKVMNEGWAAYHEALMMGGETFADEDEFLTYADHMARVLDSPGLNPYKLGKQLWTHVEMAENRRHVADQLLRVEGITWRNFHDRVDFDRVIERLEPDPVVDAIGTMDLDEIDPDDPRIDSDELSAARAGEVDAARYPWKLLTYEGMAERHFALTKREHRGALRRISQQELERIARYLFDDERYGSIEAAIDEVDYAVGWDRMREIRESHNDVTFIDEFLTQEFVDENDYFAYEYLQSSTDYRVTSTDYRDVKRKLLLQFTNFGKPTVVVADGNFCNRNELLLEHRYNGVVMDLEQAKQTLERVFELWGRPVHLRTIDVEYDGHDVEVARRRDSEPRGEEVGKLLSFDGMDFDVERLDWSEVEHLAATDVDYDTKPEEWLA